MTAFRRKSVITPCSMVLAGARWPRGNGSAAGFGPGGQGRTHRHLRSATAERELHRGPGAVLAHETGEGLGPADGVIVDSDDDVPGLDAGLGGRRAGLDLLDLSPDPGDPVGAGSGVG